MNGTVLERGRRACAQRDIEQFFKAMENLGYDPVQAIALLREESQ